MKIFEWHFLLFGWQILIVDEKAKTKKESHCLFSILNNTKTLIYLSNFA